MDGNKKGLQEKSCKPLIYMVARGGIEPPTPALWVLCSNQLSYLAIVEGAYFGDSEA